MTGGLRDRLLGRSRPSLVYELPIGDVAAARLAVARAEDAVRAARYRADENAEQALAEARAALTQAEADLDACYEKVTLTALPPADFEALVALHPPREDTSDEAWNPETFPRACFLACAPHEVSEAEWEQVLAENLSLAERGELYSVAIAVNVRLVSPALPKG